MKIKKIHTASAHLLQSLCSTEETYLQLLAEALKIEAGIRGEHIYLKGSEQNIEQAETIFRQVLGTLKKNIHLSKQELLQNITTMKKNPTMDLPTVVDQVVLINSRKSVRAKSLSQYVYIDAIAQHDLVFGIGPAGTGKTYLAMAMAVRALLEKKVERIVLTRPAVEAGEKLGFLPGDLTEKVNPYLRPLYDALHDLLDVEKVSELIAFNTIEVAPLAFMRGRTLSQSFVILDEAQNTTKEQMKMFLTRIGSGTKAVITGDITQVDLPHHQKSGLVDAVEILSKIDDISICTFNEEDVVRHPLVAKIIRAYNERDQKEIQQKTLQQKTLQQK